MNIHTIQSHAGSAKSAVGEPGSPSAPPPVLRKAGPTARWDGQSPGDASAGLGCVCMGARSNRCRLLLMIINSASPSTYNTRLIPSVLVRKVMVAAFWMPWVGKDEVYILVLKPLGMASFWKHGALL